MNDGMKIPVNSMAREKDHSGDDISEEFIEDAEGIATQNYENLANM